MRTIYKYDLQEVDEQILKIPKGATILSVNTQGDCPKIWAAVDNEEPKVDRTIITIGTGNPIICDAGTLHFIGTYVLKSGFVGHVFEYIEHKRLRL